MVKMMYWQWQDPLRVRGSIGGGSDASAGVASEVSDGLCGSSEDMATVVVVAVGLFEAVSGDMKRVQQPETTVFAMAVERKTDLVLRGTYL